MSVHQNCDYKFENFQKELIELLRKTLQEITNKIEPPYYYLGFSVQEKKEYNLNVEKEKKEKETVYEIVYSLSIFNREKNINNDIKENVIVKKNLYTGLVFSQIQIPEKREPIENNNYLRFLSESEYRKVNEIYKTGKFIKGKELGNNFFIQTILIFSKQAVSAGDFAHIKNSIDPLISMDFFEKCIPLIFKSELKDKPTRVIELNDINILKNKYILIFDLKRRKERKKDFFINADVVITRKIIIDILDIASKYNFKSLNHTVDGFILIYSKENYFLENDLYKFLQELNKFYTSFKDFLKNLSSDKKEYLQFYEFYKVRGILKKCPMLFEYPHQRHYNHKFYYSKYLDGIFYDFNDIMQEETKSKYSNKDILFTIEKNIEIPKIEEKPELSENFKFWIG